MRIYVLIYIYVPVSISMTISASIPPSASIWNLDPQKYPLVHVPSSCSFCGGPATPGPTQPGTCVCQTPGSVAPPRPALRTGSPGIWSSRGGGALEDTASASRVARMLEQPPPPPPPPLPPRPKHDFIRMCVGLQDSSHVLIQLFFSILNCPCMTATTLHKSCKRRSDYSRWSGFLMSTYSDFVLRTPLPGRVSLSLSLSLFRFVYITIYVCISALYYIFLEPATVQNKSPTSSCVLCPTTL